VSGSVAQLPEETSWPSETDVSLLDENSRPEVAPSASFGIASTTFPVTEIRRDESINASAGDRVTDDSSGTLGLLIAVIVTMVIFAALFSYLMFREDRQRDLEEKAEEEREEKAKKKPLVEVTKMQ
jgi:hypothetical protein